MTTPIKLRDPHNQGRSYTYSFTFGGLATLVAALTLALTLFFVLGVLVGRGHRPEAAVPPIARIMPTEPSANADSAEILKAEELQYGESLAAKGTEPTPSKPIDQVERKAPEKAKAPESDKKEADKKEAGKATDKAAEKLTDKKTAEAAKASEKEADKEAEKDTKRYDYIYQAGSFPEQEQAKSFLKKVKAAGLPKASIETGTVGGKPWYRVVVPFQGTPVETRGLKAKLGGIGVTKIVMRSKKPAK